MSGTRTQNMNSTHLHMMQAVFVLGITLSSKSFNFDNKHQWIVLIARYVVYILTVNTVKTISILVFELVRSQKVLDAQLLSKVDRNQVLMYIGSVGIVYYFNEQKLYMEDFPLICLANLIVSYHTMAESKSSTDVITYGRGMACSYVEGYLVHVIPSDGCNHRGFQENIRYFESKQGVVFPLKRLFIIVTKSMHCPPDLNEFNDKSDRDDVTRLEACQSFREVVKDVAGVKGRYYQNSAYKINRPNKRPVYIAAECATIIHTLYKVYKNRDLYNELGAISPESVVAEFITTLTWILEKSPDLKNKCEILYFDDTNPDLNLADVILERIQERVPDFEKYLSR